MSRALLKKEWRPHSTRCMTGLLYREGAADVEDCQEDEEQ